MESQIQILYITLPEIALLKVYPNSMVDRSRFLAIIHWPKVFTDCLIGLVYPAKQDDAHSKSLRGRKLGLDSEKGGP